MIAALLTLALGATHAFASHTITTWLSTGPTGGNGAFPAYVSGFSDDGSRAFFTTAERMVAADTDSSEDIYERTGSTTTLISTGPAGGNGPFSADFFDASKDGSRVFFETDEGLVAGDTDGKRDVYERVGSTTNLVSTGPNGGNGPQEAFFGGISQDGLHVYFMSYEPLVAEDNDQSRKDVYERFNGTTSLVSKGSVNGNALLEANYAGSTPDGSDVWFTTQEQLEPGDTDSQTDVYERSAGTTTRQISVGNANFPAFFEGASQTGSRIFWSTNEQALPSDTDAFRDIYERAGATTNLISVGPNGGNGAYQVSFGGASLDGTRVFFQTREPLVASDTDGSCLDTQDPPQPTLLCNDVYERTGSTTTWISTGGNGSHEASFAAISREGGRVFFHTTESLVGADGDGGAQDVYERFAGTTNLVSQGPAGGTGMHAAEYVGSSADGTRVFFQTYEKLTTTDNDNNWLDQYERNAGATTLLSTGPTAPGADAISIWRGSSLDGTRVFFQVEENLVSGDTDAQDDAYSREAPTAGFPRPKGATPTSLSLVPAYNLCGSPNRTHGPSLVFPSCNPPVQASPILTVGSPDANGFTASSNSRIKYRVIVGVAGPPDDSDLDLVINVNDVRCRATNAACPGGSGSDFAGRLLLRAAMRVTDKYNGSPTIDAATVQDWNLDVPVQCVTTASTSAGGTCDLSTTLNALIPGAVLDAKRAIYEIGAAEARDPGPNGTGYGAGCPSSCGDGDEAVFMRQGIFVP